MASAMGATNPDRIDFSDWARGVDTVDDMLQRRWAVRSHCLACGLMMSTNLVLLRQVYGPRFSLWDRRPRCRRLLSPTRRCEGQVVFQAKPHPRVTTWTELAASYRTGLLARRPDTLNGRPVAPQD